jgi:hypothetical protein
VRLLTNGNGSTYLDNIAWSLIMKILHKDLSRLSRNAKNLRKHLKQNFNHNILAQESLDLIAQFFGWDTWNSLYVAHQKNAGIHTYWHDMRWREKTQYAENRLRSELARIKKDSKAYEESDLLHSTATWIKNQFTPNLNSLQSKGKMTLPFLGTPKPIQYSEMHPSRLREGIEFICPDTSILTQHMKEHFLPDMGNPGLIIFCSTLETLDFARMLSYQGYRTSLLANDIKSPRSLNIETKSLRFFASQEETAMNLYGIDQYLEVLKQHLRDDYQSNIVRQYIDFIIKLRIYDARKKDYALPSIHTVAELVNIHLNHESKEISLSAKAIVESISPHTQEVESALRGKPSNSFMEQWQYFTMLIYENINFAREICYPQKMGNQITINEIERPQEKEAILIPITSESYSHRVHLSIINDMLMSSFSQSSSLMGLDDVFTLATNTLIGLGPVTNLDNNLKFIQHNRAKSNIVYYGEGARCTHTVDTQITVESPSKWKVKDLRQAP